MAQLYFTRAGAERIQKQKEELVKKLQNTQSRQGEAAEVGGNVWHDNFSFEQLKREEQMLNQQISEINDKMRNMLVLDRVATDTSRLRIGHVALLEIDGEKELQAYQIGGFEDFNPDSNPRVVSYLAPLVAQLIGEKTGHAVFVETGRSETRKVTLLEIWFPSQGGKS